MRKPFRACWTSWSARSSVLVRVQVSVSSSWRLAHTAKTAKNAITLASTMIAMAVRLKRGGWGIPQSFALGPDVRKSSTAPRGIGDLGLSGAQPLLQVLGLAGLHGPCRTGLVQLDAPRLREVEQPLALGGVRGPLQERPAEYGEGDDHPLAH